MAVEVFKLVRRETLYRYSSVIPRGYKLCTVYEIGKETVAAVGMLFCFNKIYSARNYVGLYSSWPVYEECEPYGAQLVVLRCNAPQLFHANSCGLSKIPALRDYDSGEEYDISNLFWNSYMAGKDENFGWDATPSGTVLVERLTPLEEVLHLRLM